ncbi:hypothetical protein [Ectobacillus panaciterrae]|uniref:hypothetical protein n=1 Tax=Ectobacillus panaciterrae TaxID=363872 RepID=UPI001FE18A78|nr:hypothetical protein [Ectobacillus panaciterrae]
MYTNSQMPNDPRYNQQYPQYPNDTQHTQQAQHPNLRQQQYIPQEPTQQQIQHAVGTHYLYLKDPVLQIVRPWVQYGIQETQHNPIPHAMTELAAIMFLIGKGYDQQLAHYIVESWEKNGQF